MASPSSTGDNSNVTDTLTQTILNGNSSVTPQKRHLEHNDSPVSQNESTLHESFEPSSSHANSRVVKHPASISQPSSHVHGSDVQESITLSIPSHINSVEFAIPNSRPEHTNNSNILVDTSNNSSYHTFLQRDLADESNLTPESLTRRRYQLRERTAAQIAPYRHERQAIRQAFGEEAYRKIIGNEEAHAKNNQAGTHRRHLEIPEADNIPSTQHNLHSQQESFDITNLLSDSESELSELSSSSVENILTPPRELPEIGNENILNDTAVPEDEPVIFQRRKHVPVIDKDSQELLPESSSDDDIFAHIAVSDSSASNSENDSTPRRFRNPAHGVLPASFFSGRKQKTQIISKSRGKTRLNASDEVEQKRGKARITYADANSMITPPIDRYSTPLEILDSPQNSNILEAHSNRSELLEVSDGNHIQEHSHRRSLEPSHQNHWESQYEADYSLSDSSSDRERSETLVNTNFDIKTRHYIDLTEGHASDIDLKSIHSEDSDSSSDSDFRLDSEAIEFNGFGNAGRPFIIRRQVDFGSRLNHHETHRHSRIRRQQTIDASSRRNEDPRKMNHKNKPRHLILNSQHQPSDRPEIDPMNRGQRHKNSFHRNKDQTHLSIPRSHTPKNNKASYSRNHTSKFSNQHVTVTSQLDTYYNSKIFDAESDIERNSNEPKLKRQKRSEITQNRSRATKKYKQSDLRSKLKPSKSNASVTVVPMRRKKVRPQRVAILTTTTDSYMNLTKNPVQAFSNHSIEDSALLQKFQSRKNHAQTLLDKLPAASSNQRQARIDMWNPYIEDIQQMIDESTQITKTNTEYLDVRPLIVNVTFESSLFMNYMGMIFNNGSDSLFPESKFFSDLPNLRAVDWTSDRTHLSFITDTRNFFKTASSWLCDTLSLNELQAQDINQFMLFLTRFLIVNSVKLSKSTCKIFFQEFYTFAIFCLEVQIENDDRRIQTALTLATYSFPIFLLFKSNITESNIQSFGLKLLVCLASHKDVNMDLIKKIKAAENLTFDQHFPAFPIFVFTKTLNFYSQLFSDKFIDCSFGSDFGISKSLSAHSVMVFLVLASLETPDFTPNKELTYKLAAILIREGFNYYGENRDEHVHNLLLASLKIMTGWDFKIEKNLVSILFDLYSKYELGSNQITEDKNLFQLLESDGYTPKIEDSSHQLFLKGFAISIRRLNEQVSKGVQNSLSTLKETEDLREISNILNQWVAKEHQEYPDLMFVLLLLRQRFYILDDIPLGVIIKFIDFKRLKELSNPKTAQLVLNAIVALARIQMNKRGFKEVRDWFDDFLGYLITEYFKADMIFKKKQWENLIQKSIEELTHLVSGIYMSQRHWPLLLLERVLKYSFGTELPSYILTAISSFLDAYLNSVETLLNSQLQLNITPTKREKIITDALKYAKRLKVKLSSLLGTLNPEQTLTPQRKDIISLYIRCTTIIDAEWSGEIENWFILSDQLKKCRSYMITLVLKSISHKGFLQHEVGFLSFWMKLLFSPAEDRTNYFRAILDKNPQKLSQKCIFNLKLISRNSNVIDIEDMKVLRIFIEEIQSLLNSTDDSVGEMMLKALGEGLAQCELESVVEQSVFLISTMCNKDLYHILPVNRRNDVDMQVRLERAVAEPKHFQLIIYTDDLLKKSVDDIRGFDLYIRNISNAFCSRTFLSRATIARKVLLKTILTPLITDCAKFCGDSTTVKNQNSSGKPLRNVLPCVSGIIIRIVWYEYVRNELSYDEIVSHLNFLISFVINDICLKEEDTSHHVSWDIFYTVLRVTTMLFEYRQKEKYMQDWMENEIHSILPLRMVIELALYCYAKYVCNINTLKLSKEAVWQRLKSKHSNNSGSDHSSVSLFVRKGSLGFAQQSFVQNRFYIVNFFHQMLLWCDNSDIRSHLHENFSTIDLILTNDNTLEFLLPLKDEAGSQRHSLPTSENLLLDIFNFD